jgi:hypothetical protein
MNKEITREYIEEEASYLHSKVMENLNNAESRQFYNGQIELLAKIMRDFNLGKVIIAGKVGN